MTSPISPLTLRFPSADLERESLAEYARAAVRPARATTILVIGLYVGYVALDLQTGVVARFLPVRVAVVAVMSTVLALTWHPVFLRAHSWILSVGALAAAGGMLVMMALEPQHEAAYYPGIGIAIIGTFTLYRIRFPVALADALVMLITYEVLAWVYPFESAFVATMFLARRLGPQRELLALSYRYGDRTRTTMDLDLAREGDEQAAHADLMSALAEFLDPVLDSTAKGAWNPDSGAWEGGSNARIS